MVCRFLGSCVLLVKIETWSRKVDLSVLKFILVALLGLNQKTLYSSSSPCGLKKCWLGVSLGLYVCSSLSCLSVTFFAEALSSSQELDKSSNCLNISAVPRPLWELRVKAVTQWELFHSLHSSLPVKQTFESFCVCILPRFKTLSSYGWSKL